MCIQGVYRGFTGGYGEYLGREGGHRKEDRGALVAGRHCQRRVGALPLSCSIVGSAVCKGFDVCEARTGLTEAAARQEGYDSVSVLVPHVDHPHYMP